MPIFWAYLSPTFESLIKDLSLIPIWKTCRASLRTSLAQSFMNFQMVLVLLTIVMFFLSPGNKTVSELESH